MSKARNIAALNTVEVGATTDQTKSDVDALGIAATSVTGSQASAITANTSKTGITSAQASAISANTAKTGITSAQASAITANTAKVTNAPDATKLPLAGGTMTGDTLHGDNVKAKFGTGGDLEIYHDGGNSYIRDVGTGSLRLRGANLRIESEAGYDFALFTEAAGAQIYHANNEKLATTSTGIDVTGTVTADFYTPASNQTDPNDGSAYIYQQSGVGWDVAALNLKFSTGASGARSEAMRIDSSGKVGIGTSAPLELLEIHGDSPVFKLRDTSAYVLGTGPSINFQGNDSTGVIKAFAEIKGVSKGANSGELSFSTRLSGNTSERMRIASNGNVGIGVTPEAWHSNATALQVGDLGAVWVYDDNSNPEQLVLSENVYNNGEERYIQTDYASAHTQRSGVHTFKVAPSGTAGAAISWTTALTINNDGSLIKGSDSSKSFQITTDGFIKSTTNGTSGDDHITFHNANGQVGKVRTSGSSTSYNTSSDYRLKTDVLPMTGATATFKLLKPVNFEWIADGTRVDGFLAHELQEVIPAAATGSKDAMMDEEYTVTEAIEATYDEEGTEVTAAVEAVMGTRSVPDMQGIDQSKVVPLLVATVQELLARIEALEA